MHGGTHRHEPEAGTAQVHKHEHGDAHGTGQEGMDKSKLKAILTYMRDHNREHAHELKHLLVAIEDLDADEILDLIEAGARSIESAAEQIGQAVELLEEL
jgi:hypothetical protein